MISYHELVKKKFLNVPFLYWALAAVTILAIVAWKLNPTTAEEVTDPDDAGNADPSAAGGLNDPTTADYDSLLPSGTVIVAPQAQPAADAVEQTNDMWARSAIMYLINDKGVSPGDAQTAITLYLQGADLSTEQAGWRDLAIKKLELPPEPLDTIGTVTTPAGASPQRQFTNFPGKHTVKSNSDHTPTQLAALYYGSGKWVLGANKIAEMNHSYGPASTTYPAGTVVTIPEWREPVYYTSTATTNTAAKIAAKYKPNLTATQVNDLNPGMAFPVKVGTKVRVL